MDSGDLTPEVIGSPILFLGEVVVDLICERHVRKFSEADSFVPHVGGAVANTAISATRNGANAALAGAVGGDEWGEWIRTCLAGEGVDVRWLRTLDGSNTPIACVIIDDRGEPNFAIYGDAFADAMQSLNDDIEHALTESAALFFTSNTLTGTVERDITTRARSEALRCGKPIIIDANFRLQRWTDQRAAVDAVTACVPGSLLVRTNRFEAEIITGKSNSADAANALVELGAQAAVVTLGADGALLATNGGVSHVQGVPARVRSTVGAGDAFTGSLVAGLARNNYDLSSLEDALPVAVAAGAHATECWGAIPARDATECGPRQYPSATGSGPTA